MDTSTTVTAGITASQKISAQCQDSYAAAVHPDICRKKPISSSKMLVDHFEDLAQLAI